MNYLSRMDFVKCPVVKTLIELMVAKESNLCIAADLTSAREILDLAEIVGPYICIFKTHIDIIVDVDDRFIKSLQALAKQHNFLLMEDRKFADIGNTVSLQYSQGIYKIHNWADLVTVHSLPGQGVLKAIKSCLTTEKQRAVFLLAEMSSSGNLISPKYIEDTLALATDEPNVDVVAGIVCQSPDTVVSPGLLQLTPGCQLAEINDELGQVYATPDVVVKEKGADIVVVGRGIIKAKNVEDAAKTFKDALWNAYMERVIK